MSKVNEKSVFGEYKNDEDRVTTALLQVLHYGGHPLVTRVFPECALPSNEIIIRPQVRESESRPDGLIECDCRYHIYIESKIGKGMMRHDHEKEQLAANRKLVSASLGSFRYLVYITPDQDCPKELELSDVVWLNWKEVVERLRSIDENDVDRLVSFLINQFILLVDHLVYQKQTTRLLNSVLTEKEQKEKEAEEKQAKENRVIIVGGAFGEPVALKYGFYACQEARYFQPARYLAFCYKNRIQYLFEIIGEPKESENLKKIPQIAPEYFIEADPFYDESPRKYFELRLVNTFDPAIKNVSKDKNGKPCAFTYNQRYTDYNTILEAKDTDDLLDNSL